MEAASIPGRRGREDGYQKVSWTQSPKRWPCRDVTGIREVECTPRLHPEQKITSDQGHPQLGEIRALVSPIQQDINVFLFGAIVRICDGFWVLCGLALIPANTHTPNPH